MGVLYVDTRIAGCVHIHSCIIACTNNYNICTAEDAVNNDVYLLFLLADPTVSNSGIVTKSWNLLLCSLAAPMAATKTHYIIYLLF